MASARVTIHQPELWQACSKILWVNKRPLHYAELGRRAMVPLCLATDDPQLVSKVIEDVRQWFVDRMKGEVVYTGKPHCMMYFRRWLPRETYLLNDEFVDIEASATTCFIATCEAIDRKPYMMNKSGMPDTEWTKNIVKGFQIEKAVASFFQDKWPEFYRHADNHGDYTAPCNHDFKIETPSRIWLVDAAGRNRNGKYGSPNGKYRADLHVLAEISGDSYRITGFVPCRDFVREFTETTAYPFYKLEVLLNCIRDGIPWPLSKSANAISA